MARTREHRKAKHRKGILSRKRLIFGFFAGVLIFSLVFVYIVFFSPNTRSTTNDTVPKAAVIVDQLIDTYPNATFFNTASSILGGEGFSVEYFKGEEVNVTFYENLPTHGFGLIILRVHSTENATFFTAELNETTKYQEYLEMLYADQLRIVAYKETDQDRYFGITPAFVQQRMKGTFSNSIIIVMGCDGLRSGTTMAPAFINRGAKVYISWSGSVLANHTDYATTQLLRYLIQEKLSIWNAVNKTRTTVGPDPQFQSILLYYPTTEGNFVIPSIRDGVTKNLNQVIASLFTEQRKSRRLQ